MSSVIVQVVEVKKICPHPDPETTALEVCEVLGWQFVIAKPKEGEARKFTEGSVGVYFPIDTLLCKALADQFGVTKYVKWNEKLHPGYGRIKMARLRGEQSFGLIVPLPEGVSWKVGDVVTDQYDVKKYEPPPMVLSGEAEVDCPLFVKYTDIENIRNFPAVLTQGEEVILTEKIHGSNVRSSIIDGQFTAGSHTVRKRRPENDNFKDYTYWFPFTLPAVQGLLTTLGKEHKVVILFGEIYGKLQWLKYDQPHGLAYRAFDLMIDGKYVDYDKFVTYCNWFGIPMVPLVARMPYNLEVVKGHADGKSLVDGATCIREGVVVKPVKERNDPRVGRVVFKYIGNDYLNKGEKQEDFKDI
jgi:RNA ligase (TIGR02306 family)